MMKVTYLWLINQRLIICTLSKLVLNFSTDQSVFESLQCIKKDKVAFFIEPTHPDYFTKFHIIQLSRSVARWVIGNVKFRIDLCE